MEYNSKPHETENPSSRNSPNSNGTNSTVSSSNNNGGGQIPTPPLTPKLTPRSESNPYPTTFVQADTSNFKHVVQMLTGSSETYKHQSSPSPKPNTHHHQDPLIPSSSKNFNIPPIKTTPKKQIGFKLYERRSNLKNNLMINTLVPNFAHNSGFSPRYPEILSPSLLDFPSLTLSPVTPLNEEDPFDKSSCSPSLGNSSEEERAIAEKGFYFHPSPMNTPRGPEPQLLPLFPISSPKVSGSSSS